MVNVQNGYGTFRANVYVSPRSQLLSVQKIFNTTASKNTISLQEKFSILAIPFTFDNDFADPDTRTQFIGAAEKLAIAARHPNESIFLTATTVIQNTAIRIARWLTISAVVPSAKGSSISASDIALAVEAGKIVVVSRHARPCPLSHLRPGRKRGLPHNPLLRGFVVPESLEVFKKIYNVVERRVCAARVPQQDGLKEPQGLQQLGVPSGRTYRAVVIHAR